MSQFHTEELAGGTVRVGLRSETQEAISAPHEQFKVHQGVIRADGSGQHASHMQSTPTLEATGSVMATLRNNVGSQKVDSTATVALPNGMRTSLQVAESLGFVTKDSAGRYIDAVNQPGDQQAPQQGLSETAPELADRATESAFAEAIAPLEQHAFDATLAAGVNAVMDESMAGWERAVQVLSQGSGMSPDVAVDLVEKGYSFYEGQVASMATGMGI